MIHKFCEEIEIFCDSHKDCGITYSGILADWTRLTSKSDALTSFRDNSREIPTQTPSSRTTDMGF